MYPTRNCLFAVLLAAAGLMTARPADAQITFGSTHVIPPKTNILPEATYEKYLYGYYYGPSPYWYDEHYRRLYFPEYPPQLTGRAAARVPARVPPRVPRELQDEVTRPPAGLPDYHNYYLNGGRVRPRPSYAYPSTDISRVPAVRRYR